MCCPPAVCLLVTDPVTLVTSFLSVFKCHEPRTLRWNSEGDSRYFGDWETTASLLGLGTGSPWLLSFPVSRTVLRNSDTFVSRVLLSPRFATVISDQSITAPQGDSGQHVIFQRDHETRNTLWHPSRSDSFQKAGGCIIVSLYVNVLVRRIQQNPPMFVVPPTADYLSYLSRISFTAPNTRSSSLRIRHIHPSSSASWFSRSLNAVQPLPSRPPRIKIFSSPTAHSRN